jgi:phosphoribosylglycinamide formyltransferase 1
MKKRVGVLISGRGSNMRSLVEAARSPDYPAEIVGVLSNKAEAGGLQFAEENGIATHVINHRDYTTREAFDAAIDDWLRALRVDIVCCAGFMRIITPVLTSKWKGQMLNIHPSLLPDYPGLHTHARAIADGRTLAGCTVHFVTDELDGGPIVAQATVPVLHHDTPESLAARVLEKEHELYVKALELVAHGQIKFT